MKRFLGRFSSWLFSSVRSRLIVAAVVSLLLTLCDYLLSNYPFPILDDVDSIAMIELLSGRSRSSEASRDSVVYLNLAYDKELAVVVDDFGDTIGRTAVSDRSALLNTLRILKESDYRYIILDVRFDADTRSPGDTLLWRQIASTPRIVYSRHSGSEDAADDICGERSAISDYGVTLSTGFTRWQFLKGDEPTLPLKAYGELSGRGIKRKGIFFFDNGRLCRNTLFIPLSSEFESGVSESGEIRYPFLGSDVMRLDSEEEIRRMVKGKIVVIGDFENDVHDTYVGSVAGPEILYQSLRRLLLGKHICNVWEEILIFMLFFAIGFFCSGKDSLWNRVDWIKRYRLLSLVFSFLTWELALNVASISFYLLWGEYFITFLPSMVFTAIGWLSGYKKT